MKLRHVLFVFLMTALGVQAGITMIAEEVSGSTITKMFMEGDHIRVDIDDGEGRMSMLYDTEAGSFWMVNHDERNYMQIDKAQIEQMMGTMNQMMKQMQDSFQNMPPEQRAMMERMMGGAMPVESKEPPKRELKATGEKKKVDGKTCQRYVQTVDGEMENEFWVATFKELKISKSDVKAMHKMSQSQQEMLDTMKDNPFAGAMEGGLQAYEEMDGIPLITKNYSNGRVVHETHVRQVKPGPLDEGLFKLPQGYRKQEMPGMGGGAPQGRGGIPPISIPGLLGN